MMSNILYKLLLKQFSILKSSFINLSSSKNLAKKEASRVSLFSASAQPIIESHCRGGLCPFAQAPCGGYRKRGDPVTEQFCQLFFIQERINDENKLVLYRVEAGVDNMQKIGDW